MRKIVNHSIRHKMITHKWFYGTFSNHRHNANQKSQQRTDHKHCSNFNIVAKKKSLIWLKIKSTRLCAHASNFTNLRKKI